MRDDAAGSRGDASENQYRSPMELAREGITAARIGDFEKGYALLGEACDRVRKAGEKVPAPAISYFGLCLAVCKGHFREAAGFCQAAVDADPIRAEYYLNLAKVFHAGGFRRKAIAAVERGLALEAENQPLLALRTTLGVRRRPVIPFLSRANPLNVSLGRLRHALSATRKSPGATHDRKPRG